MKPENPDHDGGGPGGCLGHSVIVTVTVTQARTVTGRTLIMSHPSYSGWPVAAAAPGPAIMGHGRELGKRDAAGVGVAPGSAAAVGRAATLTRSQLEVQVRVHRGAPAK